MHPSVAAITMVFDEPDLLPVWSRHYARQVGADRCYVIDHGSTIAMGDLMPGTNVLRIPRSAHDDELRARFISTFAAALLQYHDWVAYTDVDELLLADPDRHRDLTAFCATLDTDTVTTIGFDVQHCLDTEPDAQPTLSIGNQRGWMRFTSAMCKPVLTRRPLLWAPGFHTADTNLVFDELYLFHLHWADQAIGLRRLHKTQTMPWADQRFGAHQRISDRQWSDTFQGMARLPLNPAAALDPTHRPLAPWLDRVRSGFDIQPGGCGTVPLDLNAPELWPIPDRFRARL